MRALLLASTLFFALPAVAQADGLVALLRGHLDTVRVAETTIESMPDPIPDPRPLVGLSRSTVQAGLGEPSLCSDSGILASEQVACSNAESWTYSFYRFVPVHPGGGPELVLQFTADGRVRSAQWWHSQ